MSTYDYRTKPKDLWTYYVIDHLPSMANIYRFDSMEEAIACYRAIDPALRSAIGSSFGGFHEMDHIHRCGNDIPVLVTASDHIKNPLWRDSVEIQNAIDYMIAALGVTCQRSHGLFGNQIPSTIIALERHQQPCLDRYFRHSILLPSVPGQYNSSITEAYVMGHGWLTSDAFFRLLRDSLPGRDGVPKDVFLERLNVRYLDTHNGYIGEADISPAQFVLLRQRTERLLSPDVIKADIGALLSMYCENDLGDKQPLSDNMTAGDYRRLLRDILHDPTLSSDMRSSVEALHHRVLALLPQELRTEDLSKRIRIASDIHQSLMQDQPAAALNDITR